MEGKGSHMSQCPSLLEGPRYLGHSNVDSMEGLEKPTLGGCRIVGTGTLWSAAGTCCVALGGVQALSPQTVIAQHIVEAAYAVTVLSSALHRNDSNKIFLRKHIVHLLFSVGIRWEKQPKVIHWLTSRSYFKFHSLGLLLGTAGCSAEVVKLCFQWGN